MQRGGTGFYAISVWRGVCFVGQLCSRIGNGSSVRVVRLFLRIRGQALRKHVARRYLAGDDGGCLAGPNYNAICLSGTV
jgi:hypothetical protein